jgi:subtilisin family serine protease
MRDVISDLKSLGIATVIAAGNKTSGNTGKIAFPACVEGAIAVSATEPLDNSIASYAQNGALTTFFAPGSSMWLPNANGYFGLASGTSFASPTVAGAYAVLRSKYPTATVDQLTNILAATGKPITDSRSGYNNIKKPLIQVDKALKSLSAPSADHIYVKNGTALKSFIDDLDYPFAYSVSNNSPDIAFSFSSGRTPYDTAGKLEKLSNGGQRMPTGAKLTLTSYAVDGAVNHGYDIVVRGDVNKDAEIDIADLAQLSGYLRNLTTLTNASWLASDANQDGELDIGDLVKISAHIRGIKEME